MPVVPSVDFDVFINTASTCDVVLRGGSSLNSTGIEIIGRSPFSHTTMVIVNPATGERYLYQATNTPICPIPSTAERCTRASRRASCGPPCSPC